MLFIFYFLYGIFIISNFKWKVLLLKFSHPLFHHLNSSLLFMVKLLVLVPIFPIDLHTSTASLPARPMIWHQAYSLFTHPNTNKWFPFRQRIYHSFVQYTVEHQCPFQILFPLPHQGDFRKIWSFWLYQLYWFLK